MPAKTAARIPLDQFVETTLASLLRAIEVRRFPRGPILIGIIYRPEEFGGRQLPGGVPAPRPRKRAGNR